jgi:hypothetical protein
MNPPATAHPPPTEIPLSATEVDAQLTPIAKVSPVTTLLVRVTDAVCVPPVEAELACTQPAVPPGHVWPTQNELNKSRNELKKKTHLEFLVMSTALGPFPALARGARPLAQ